jgi:hypothetical protein
MEVIDRCRTAILLKRFSLMAGFVGKGRLAGCVDAGHG